ncbi:hypothetical protein BDF14DRAFT_1505726 [Spinellus fusiger]|nr:hypothetical protein BDF14DRAFT_1505726 [Spinellus fusiger]
MLTLLILSMNSIAKNQSITLSKGLTLQLMDMSSLWDKTYDKENTYSKKNFWDELNIISNAYPVKEELYSYIKPESLDSLADQTLPTIINNSSCQDQEDTAKTNNLYTYSIHQHHDPDEHKNLNMQHWKNQAKLVLNEKVPIKKRNTSKNYVPFMPYCKIENKRKKVVENMEMDSKDCPRLSDDSVSFSNSSQESPERFKKDQLYNGNPLYHEEYEKAAHQNEHKHEFDEEFMDTTHSHREESPMEDISFESHTQERSMDSEQKRYFFINNYSLAEKRSDFISQRNFMFSPGKV